MPPLIRGSFVLKSALGRADQGLRVVSYVVLHEGRDEVIAVIVTRQHPQRQVDPGRAAGIGEQLRLQLVGEEIVRLTLIDQ